MSDMFVGLLNELAREPGAPQQSLAELRLAAGADLPDDYLRLLKYSNGVSGWLCGRYLIVYSASEAITVNRAANTMEYAPSRLIFGSNGGGTSYLLELGDSAVTPVYRCEDVELGHEYSSLIASSIEEFLLRFGPEVG